MPAGLSLDRSTDSENRCHVSVLPPVQRWIVLGLLVGLLLFSTQTLWPVKYTNESWRFMVWLGVWLAHACLPPVWAAAGRPAADCKVAASPGMGRRLVAGVVMGGRPRGVGGM